VRVVAIIAAHDEERMMGACLEHLFEQGVRAYLIDHGSTDRTTAVAERYLGRGLIGIETVPHEGTFRLRAQLERKERLAAELDADWLIHQDVDEFRISRGRRRLVEALAEVDRSGFNAVNFLEFAFIPTRESPDHDHVHFTRTMRWYYPFLPQFPHRLNAWKRQEEPVRLAWSGGHRVSFPDLRMAPGSLGIRHYLCLSASHALRKFSGRRYEPAELAAGWHRWRASLTPERLILPSKRELRTYVSDDRLDASNARRRHLMRDDVAHFTDCTESSSRSSSAPPQSGARGTAQRSEPPVTGTGSTAQA
jgi:glycosyltransferase involved in cell wall biosynthesis